MKKFTAILLCLVMLLSVFQLASCGSEKETESSSESVSGAGDDELNLTDEIPDGKYDFGGRDFIITVPWPDYFGVNNYDMQEITNDTVYDEIYYRNRYIEQRFNAKISAVEIGLSDTTVESLSPFILGDTGEFNLICFAYSTSSYGLISSGLITTWNDIPVINFKKPWWNDTATNCGTINGKMFFNAGSFNWYSLPMTTVFYFNEKLRQEFGIEDLYALVENGDWTMDKLQEFCRLAAKDLDSDGRFTVKDQYGLVTSCFDHMAVSCGFETVVNNGDGTFRINVGNEKHQAILNKILDIMKRTNNIAFNGSDSKFFLEDRALFFGDWLYNVDTLRIMESDFGIIPYPKFDENQEQYCSFSQAWGLANALPITTRESDYDFIGVMMESLGAESYNKIIPAYYEYTLKGRDTRDTESWKMLDLIMSTLVYDFGYFYSAMADGTDYTFDLKHLVKYGHESSDLASFAAQHQDFLESFYSSVMDLGK